MFTSVRLGHDGRCHLGPRWLLETNKILSWKGPLQATVHQEMEVGEKYTWTRPLIGPSTHMTTCWAKEHPKYIPLDFLNHLTHVSHLWWASLFPWPYLEQSKPVQIHLSPAVPSTSKPHYVTCLLCTIVLFIYVLCGTFSISDLTYVVCIPSPQVVLSSELWNALTCYDFGISNCTQQIFLTCWMFSQKICPLLELQLPNQTLNILMKSHIFPRISPIFHRVIQNSFTKRAFYKGTESLQRVVAMEGYFQGEACLRRSPVTLSSPV